MLMGTAFDYPINIV